MLKMANYRDKCVLSSELNIKTDIHYIFSFDDFRFAKKKILSFSSFGTGCQKKHGTFLFKYVINRLLFDT